MVTSNQMTDDRTLKLNSAATQISFQPAIRLDEFPWMSKKRSAKEETATNNIPIEGAGFRIDLNLNNSNSDFDLCTQRVISAHSLIDKKDTEPA